MIALFVILFPLYHSVKWLDREYKWDLFVFKTHHL